MKLHKVILSLILTTQIFANQSLDEILKECSATILTKEEIDRQRMSPYIKKGAGILSVASGATLLVSAIVEGILNRLEEQNAEQTISHGFDSIALPAMCLAIIFAIIASNDEVAYLTNQENMLKEICDLLTGYHDRNDSDKVLVRDAALTRLNKLEAMFKDLEKDYKKDHNSIQEAFYKKRLELVKQISKNI